MKGVNMNGKSKQGMPNNAFVSDASIAFNKPIQEFQQCNTNKPRPIQARGTPTESDRLLR